MIYFGSDWHLGHKKILTMENRPFNTIEDMDNFFIKYTLSVLKPNDELYLLGDICWRTEKIYLEKLQGSHRNIHLIVGNHDHEETRKTKYWASVNYYKELKIEDKFIVLCHYPIEVWNRQHYGSIHLHGHLHGNTSHKASFKRNRYDVGYDSTFNVITPFPAILEKINYLQHKEK